MARRSLRTGALGAHGRLAMPVGHVGTPFTLAPKKPRRKRHGHAVVVVPTGPRCRCGCGRAGDSRDYRGFASYSCLERGEER